MRSKRWEQFSATFSEAACPLVETVGFAPGLAFPVNALSTMRSRRWQIPVLLLGVAVAVFTWGLQYKLSLYDPPQAVTRKMPRAKLLSADEQAAVAASPVASLAKPPAKAIQAIFFCILFTFLLPLASPVSQLGSQQESTAERLRLPRWSVNINAFFRPPPFLHAGL